MKILVLGGTQFVGRHIVEALLAAGHAVTILNRGMSPDALPAAVERLRGDRDEGHVGLRALAGRSWDTCVDVTGYLPRQVRSSADMLASNVRRYVYVSAVRVYGDPQDRPVRETHALVAPAGEDVIEIDNVTYGTLKVACENIVQGIYAERSTILRPQIVVGPHDPSGRYTYWLKRSMMGGEMLAPGDGADHVQLIDARDIGRFTATLIENDLGGPFNLAGHRQTWGQFIKLLGVLKVVWVPAEILRSAVVTERELPLFRPERGPHSGLMDVSNEKARKAGLSLTDPEVTLRDTKGWMAGEEHTLALSSKREAELIRLKCARPERS